MKGYADYGPGQLCANVGSTDTWCGRAPTSQSSVARGGSDEGMPAAPATEFLGVCSGMGPGPTPPIGDPGIELDGKYSRQLTPIRPRVRLPEISHLVNFPKIPPIPRPGGPVDHPKESAEDSGYGSIAERARFSNSKPKEEAGGRAPMQSTGVDDDAETTYSKATNERPAQTHDFVHELANDIYEKLKLFINPDDWSLVSRSLPELLKAFAIRIGSDGASQASRGVMYTIHKEHRNIANQLKNLLLDPVEDLEAPRADGDTDLDIMSLQDKMDMWHKQTPMQESAPESSELFQNVTDDDSNMTASLMYIKMVLESEHYHWLIQSLKTELSLDRGKTEPSNERVSVLQQILSMFPRGSISKKRYPADHHAVFQFPAQLTRRTWRTRFLFSHPLVVTPDCQNLQFTGILAYVNQTWPSFGEEVLSFFERAFEHCHTRPTIRSSRSTLFLINLSQFEIIY
ncbi:hypothetical protein NW759_008728 [Fusarium solani]|nr:hypothetical protein NW759_008728 [Fusarium solani]